MGEAWKSKGRHGPMGTYPQPLSEGSGGEQSLGRTKAGTVAAPESKVLFSQPRGESRDIRPVGLVKGFWEGFFPSHQHILACPCKAGSSSLPWELSVKICSPLMMAFLPTFVWVRRRCEGRRVCGSPASPFLLAVPGSDNAGGRDSP